MPVKWFKSLHAHPEVHETKTVKRCKRATSDFQRKYTKKEKILAFIDQVVAEYDGSIRTKAYAVSQIDRIRKYVETEMND